MYDKDFAELVKIAAEKLKEDTVYKMLTRSEDYQKESDARDKAERNYEQLDLTTEQRKVCDVFLDYRDRQSLEYSDYSYLAGLYDAFRIMAVIFPDRWDMDQIQKAFCLWYFISNTKHQRMSRISRWLWSYSVQGKSTRMMTVISVLLTNCLTVWKWRTQTISL